MKILECGSISRAASALDLPQPSVSSLLKRIERSLGGTLFVRGKDGVRPTIFGEEIIPRLGQLVRHADEIIAEAHTQHRDSITFGNFEWMPAALRVQICRSLPGLTVRTASMTPEAALEALTAGTLTAALVPNLRSIAPLGLGVPDVDAEIVVREPICAAVPSGHVLSGERSVHWTDLVGMFWVRQQPGHWFFPAEEYILNELVGVDSAAVHRVSGHAEAMSWVRDLGATALTPPSGGSPDVYLLRVVDAPISDLTLLWRRGALASSVRDRLVEAIRGFYAEYLASLPHHQHVHQHAYPNAHPNAYPNAYPNAHPHVHQHPRPHTHRDPSPRRTGTGPVLVDPADELDTPTARVIPLCC